MMQEYCKEVTVLNFFCRSHDSAEQKISVHCSEDGLINTLQMLTSLYPEAVNNIEMFPLGQVSSNVTSFYFSQHYLNCTCLNFLNIFRRKLLLFKFSS